MTNGSGMCPETLFAGDITTPLGRLVAVVDAPRHGALVRLDFAAPDDAPRPPAWRGLPVRWDRPEAIAEAAEQVAEYFAGRRRAFDLRLAPRGGQGFNRAVWDALPREVPFGATATYGEVARRLGRPGAARAVGHANATNPISLVVPCHRVIGAGGRLVGYGGGEGIATKRALLAHEAHIAGQSFA